MGGAVSSSLHRPRQARSARLLSRTVPLIDVLGDFEDRLGTEETARLRRAVRARALGVRRGLWNAPSDAGEHARYGFLVVDGAILRNVRAGHREGGELLGPGDLLQPATDRSDGVVWRAARNSVLAILDAEALASAAAVPELLFALLTATSTRANGVARQLVVAQWSSADERILATMQTLSERWGVMTAEGVVLPGFLTHAVLAPLVGARRPSVTTALKRLKESGALSRTGDGRWILPHAGA